MRLGFPKSSGKSPCFCCAGSGEDLFDLSEVSVLSLPWPTNDSRDYDEACRRCEIWVLLQDTAARDYIVSLLEYDRRQGGQHGRVLTQDVPYFSLKARDRLEPCTALPDIGALDQLEMPATICFGGLPKRRFAITAARSVVIVSE